MSFGRILALALLSVAASAQNYTSISGLIVDPSAASVPDAAVTVVNEDTGVRRIAVTQADGSYAVSSLEPGVYKITVRKAGFRTMIRFGVKLTAAQPARVDFKLIVGSFQETVTVESSAPLLSSEDVAVGTLVSQQQIQHLPLDGRGLLSLLELAPGLIVTPATRGEAGQFTVNGQRPNTHYFMVDGASANSGVSGGGVPAQSTGGTLPGMTAFGSLDSLVSLDALQEMRVQTSTTASEFGRMPGAQISLVSRSGSNELHGSLLYGFRNEALNANDWFANRHGDPRAPLRQHDLAATLGGPVWRDHTFFFLSYERMRLRQPFVWNQPVPTLDARENSLVWASPLLKLFPEPNGPSLGTGLAEWTAGISRPTHLDAGAVRLDHAFTSRLTAFARYNEAPSSTEFGSDPINTLDIRARALTVGLTLRAQPNLIWDLRMNASSAEARSIWQGADPASRSSCYIEPVTKFFLLTPGVCDYLVRLTIAGVGQVVSGSEGRRDQTQLQIAPTGNWNRGSHAVRFGADYRRLAPRRNDATSSLGILADTVADLFSSSNFWVAKNDTPQRVSAVVREISVFAQDTWRATPRLTFTYGLRWEISPAPTQSRLANLFDPLEGNPAPARQSLWSSTYANFAPRVGVAYQPTANGRTVLRGGFGLYYDSSLNLATDLVNDGPLNISNFQSSRNFILAHLNYGYLSNLHLPLIKQWNATVEHAFTSHDVLSAGYVGASGDDLIRREIGGPGSTPSALLALATNHGASSYHALEAQYRRRFARGLEAQASYAWSHSLDNSSTDAGLYWAGSGLAPSRDRASSDFDTRHSFAAGFTYQLPRGFALDGMFRARAGFPINVLEAEQFEGIVLENAFRPDRIPGEPLWIAGRINRDAFHPAPNSVQGNLGRNALTGYGMSQLDVAVRREFRFSEQRSLEFRAEAFNALNHPNFADPVRFLSSPLFGQSTSMLNLMLGTGSPGSGLAPVFQAGGPRSLRMVVRFRF